MSVFHPTTRDNQEAIKSPRKQDLELLPTEKEWIEHANLLLKFWLQDSAIGTPVGNFPTWRSNDGSIINGPQKNSSNKLHDTIATPTTSLGLSSNSIATNTTNTANNNGLLNNGLSSANSGAANDIPRDLELLFKHYCVGIDTLLNRKYVRMMSRQTFAYGALFNLTGNPEALRLHQAGVRYLLDHARDKDGIFYTFFEEQDGIQQGKPSLNQRAIQDLAGATLGLSMNVYLTHSQESLNAIEIIRKYIYEQCAATNSHILKWVPEDFEADPASDIQLSPQLDELNCYLLLLMRLLPNNLKAPWEASIAESLNVIESYFTAMGSNKFYGKLHGDISSPDEIGEFANYGHGIKTWWMKDIAASLFGDNSVAPKALEGIASYIKGAISSDKSNWYEDDERHDATWWVWAELDQGMLHAALVGNTQITGTLKTWTQKYTDRVYGEVTFGQKQHFWRNGYHSSEHALVGYILSQGIRELNGEKAEVTLHFAVPSLTATSNTPTSDPKTKSVESSFTPYYYSGDIDSITNNSGIQTVKFSGIRAPDKIS